jgi:hypothetical protein
VLGIAPNATLVGRSIFGASWQGTPATYVPALNNINVTSGGRTIDINSNSWGPAGLCTSGCYFGRMSDIVIQAIHNGCDYGRNGKGVVYVFAAGNDGGYT